MQREIAEALLKIQAVFLRPQQPFTWASGIQSPIYCDNRLTLSYPEVRTLIETAFADVIRAEFPACEALFGTSTAGIPHAAITAQLMNLPMGYVRGSEKTHGRNNRIEGRLTPGQKVVVVEDLISTAGSVIEVVEALREAGAEVLGIVSIFTYGMKLSVTRLQAASVRSVSLSNLDTLVDVAVELHYIPESHKQALLDFRDNPADESWMAKLAD